MRAFKDYAAYDAPGLSLTRELHRAEVYTALERGVLDAGLTSAKPGFGLRWYEVSKYLVGPISMRPHVALSMNKAA